MNSTVRTRFERPFWVLAYLVSPVIPLSFYFAGNWFSFFHSWSLSMTFGIIAYVWFLNQFIVAARPSYWDRLYGLDRMYRFHGYMAIVATLFVIAHIVLKRLTFPVITAQQAVGAAAFFVFIVVIIATVFFMIDSWVTRIRPLDRLKRVAAEKWRWQYHQLKRFHNLVVIAALLAMAHVLMAFSTLESFSRISVMAVWFVGTVGWYGWHKVLKPMREKKSPFTVESVARENETVTTVRLVPPEGRAFRYKAGQFVYLRFLDGTPGPEEHPFTLSSSPGEDTIAITAKDLGDFSGGLPAVQAGAPVLIDGPYGVFRSDKVSSDRPLVFIAGGIGITPFLSMLGDLVARADAKGTDARETDGNKAGSVEGVSSPEQRQVHLLWSIRDETELCLLDRLSGYLDRLPGLGIELFLSRGTGGSRPTSIPEAFRFSEGRITIEHLAERGLVGTGREFFTCGPLPLMESIIQGLRSHGIPGKMIHHEAFSL
jgi:predicted ferric reductase